MTIVFVNGVPVTPAVWAPLISELPGSRRREAVLLAPPGFGAPLPPGFRGDDRDRARRMVEWGIPEPTAGQVAAGQGSEMGRAILALYRSIPPEVLLERGRELPAAAASPGLVPVATEDLTGGSVALRHRAARRAGARAVDLDGLGHWWMLQDPARTARVLTEFWDNL